MPAGSLRSPGAESPPTVCYQHHAEDGREDNLIGVTAGSPRGAGGRWRADVQELLAPLHREREESARDIFPERDCKLSHSESEVYSKARQMPQRVCVSVHAKVIF